LRDYTRKSRRIKKKKKKKGNQRNYATHAAQEGRPHRVDSKNTNESYFWLLHVLFEHDGMTYFLACALHLLAYIY
jgi:hypothetical protein